MYCSKCGALNDDAAYNCIQCGQALGPARAAQQLSQARDVPTYLAQAILVTLLCCLPFGIVAIVYAAQVSGKLSAGDYQGALETSNKARTWCWVAFLAGVIPAVIYLIIMLVAGLGGALG